MFAVFVNKSLLSGSLSDAPLFVTWYQCVVTVLSCYVLRQLARYLPGKISFPELDLDVNIMKEVRGGSVDITGGLTFYLLSAPPSLCGVRRNDHIEQSLPQECRSLILLYRKASRP